MELGSPDQTAACLAQIPNTYNVDQFGVTWRHEETICIALVENITYKGAICMFLPYKHKVLIFKEEASISCCGGDPGCTSFLVVQETFDVFSSSVKCLATCDMGFRDCLTIHLRVWR